MPPRRRNRYAEQALAEAELKFGPQRAALVNLLRETAGASAQDVKQAKRGATMVRDAARQSRPDMQQIYSQAQGQQSAVNALLAADLAKLGPEANAYKLAAKIGTGGATARTAEAGSRAVGELVSRETDAVQGGVQEVRNIRQRYRADSRKILDQLKMTADQVGTYVPTRYAALLDDRRGRQVTRRGQDITAEKNRADIDIKRGVDPVTNRPFPPGHPNGPKPPGGGGGGGGGGKSKSKSSYDATPTARSDAQDQIQLAISTAATMKNQGLSRSEIAEALKIGAKAKTEKLLDANGEPVLKKQRDGTFKERTRALPAIPKIPSQVYLSAALDQVFHGRLSPQNQRRLHTRGLRIRDLPVTPAGRRPRVRTPAVRNAPGSRGQARPT